MFCPQCGAHYRVPEQDLDLRIACGDCHRSFLARTAYGKRRKPNSNAKAFTLFGVAVVVLGLSFFVLSNQLGKRAEADKPAPEKAAKVDLYRNLRVDTVRNWVAALASGDSLNARFGADMAALQKRYSILPQYSYEHSSGDALQQLDKAILELLKSGEPTRYLRELKFDTAQLADERSASADRGSVRVMLSTPLGDVRFKPGTAEVRIDFRMDKSRLLVTGWEVVVPPVETGLKKPRRRRQHPARRRRQPLPTPPSPDTNPT